MNKSRPTIDLCIKCKQNLVLIRGTQAEIICDECVKKLKDEVKNLNVDKDTSRIFK